MSILLIVLALHLTYLPKTSIPLARLDEISAPTLVMAGGRTWRTASSPPRSWPRAPPELRLNLEAPGAFNEAVAGFLKGWQAGDNPVWYYVGRGGMVTEPLATVFTVIGGFAGAVYLVELFWRAARWLSGAEAAARRRNWFQTAETTVQIMGPRIGSMEERLSQAAHRQAESLEMVAQAFAAEMPGLHQKLDGLAQAIDELKRQE